MNVFEFPGSNCSSCGKLTKRFIDLVDVDTGNNAGHKYLCDDCQPLDEDGLRLLVDKRDEEISFLRQLLTRWMDDDAPMDEQARVVEDTMAYFKART